MRTTFVLGAAALAAAIGIAAPAAAQTIELKVHHFLPAGSPAQKVLIEPWAQEIESKSGGRLKARIFPAMQLGGRPPQLIDQVRDGVADVVWTLPSYTPGRFPIMSVFELPFMISDSQATSKATQEFYETHARAEFADAYRSAFGQSLQ